MIQTPTKFFRFESVEPETTQAVKASGSTFLRTVQTAAKSQRYSKNMAKIAVPTNDGLFNIVKKFRWTKSSLNSVTVNNTPTITLREMEVVNPAFFNNLALFIDQLVSPERTGLLDVGQKLTGPQQGTAVQRAIQRSGVDPDAPGGFWSDLAGGISDWAGKGIHELFSSGVIGANAVSADFEALRKHVLGANRISGPAYLRNYERIYGIHYTGFKYNIPYLEDSYKQINNSWGSEGSNFLIKSVGALSNITSLLSPSVGVDFAKTFDYPQAGPSYDINFFLDNTVYDQKSTALDNLTFIYLLLYQNLPNRINRTSLTPPVIYQAFCPGVFSYRWSFLSKINVNFVGVRRPFHANLGGEQVEAIVPEGYEVQLTLTSLTPETKNLFFDSLNNAVNATEVVKESSESDIEKGNALREGVPQSLSPWSKQRQKDHGIFPPDPKE